MDEPDAPDPTENGPADDGMTAVVEPKKAPKKERKRNGIPRYNVILWDDDDHTYEYVIRMLKDLFGHPEEKGFKLADKVNAEGRVVVLTTTKEHAELKREQVHAYGKDEASEGCAGSMTASIEPAE
ncbi:MAG: ATP-dependent Clp protease adaptor ClpS [Planctomycetota bacterium]